MCQVLRLTPDIHILAEPIKEDFQTPDITSFFSLHLKKDNVYFSLH